MSEVREEICPNIGPVYWTEDGYVYMYKEHALKHQAKIGKLKDLALVSLPLTPFSEVLEYLREASDAGLLEYLNA